MAVVRVEVVLLYFLFHSCVGVHGIAQIGADHDEAEARLEVDGTRLVAKVDKSFICATIDWWPPTKCNYGSCPWGLASLLNLDLSNPLLERTLAGLAPLTIRIGGTLQDLVVYDVGNLIPSESCKPFTYNATGLFSYSGGCLAMARWDEINQLFMKVGISVAFGLNALYGRSKSSEYNVIEPWDPSNAESFIRYTHAQGYPVTAWQLGNELLGFGIGKRVSPDLYAADVKKLRNIIDNIYEQDPTKPLVVAPDSFYDVGSKEIPRFLKVSGPNVVDVVTRHIYNLGAGVTGTEELIDKILSHAHADGEAAKYKSLHALLQEHPTTKAWIGEAGGAYNSGHHDVTDAYVFAFWYLDQLGLASRYDNQEFCRQSFVGGHYGLIDSNFQPNPDYYGAMLWSRVMGTGVLNVDITNPTGDVRAYAHCQKDNEVGLALLILNYSNTTRYKLEVIVKGKMDLSGVPQFEGYNPVRLEYHMTPANSSITSRVVLLNGEPLQLTPSQELPTLLPVAVDISAPIVLEPLTYAFVVLPQVETEACSQS